ncbi:MAG TPA: hypothetical protein VJ843_03990 [Candidatus Saccharimonadales bacterium]|nr:hypothetical protein [Candidatus Saccharimonadales bacterium]
MSTEQLSRFEVTKFDTTERWREGWPHHFHYEVRDTTLDQTAGFLTVRHWLETHQVEADDLELHNPATAKQVGVHVLRACGKDLRLLAIPELRFAEPLQDEIIMAREAFGDDALQMAYKADASQERQPYPQTLDELVERTAQEFAPLADAGHLDMWIDLRAQNMTEWPDAPMHQS